MILQGRFRGLRQRVAREHDKREPSRGGRLSYLRRVLDRLQRMFHREPPGLDLAAMPIPLRQSPPPRFHPRPANKSCNEPQPSGPVADHYLVFQNAEYGRFMGQPVQFLPGYFQATAIQAGSHNPLGEPGIWANSFHARGELSWVDDPVDGFFKRKIYRLQDALGARGSISGILHRFDDILQIGRNLVVYQLTNLETCNYLPYGFPREIFDARHALTEYLERASKGRAKYQDETVVDLCDRVLEAYPQDETALFNKGVALAAKRDFKAAHECFSVFLAMDDEDQLCLLYDAHALAELGDHGRAAGRLLQAAAIHGEELQGYLNRFKHLRAPLSASVRAVIENDPLRADVGGLWLRYFYAEAEEVPREQTRTEARRS
jgi:tetratricopeptide (TPR) repeat protein